jgi:hypothetical protein
MVRLPPALVVVLEAELPLAPVAVPAALQPLEPAVVLGSKPMLLAPSCDAWVPSWVPPLLVLVAVVASEQRPAPNALR